MGSVHPLRRKDTFGLSEEHYAALFDEPAPVVIAEPEPEDEPITLPRWAFVLIWVVILTGCVAMLFGLWSLARQLLGGI